MFMLTIRLCSQWLLRFCDTIVLCLWYMIKIMLFGEELNRIKLKHEIKHTWNSVCEIFLVLMHLILPYRLNAGNFYF